MKSMNEVLLSRVDRLGLARALGAAQVLEMADRLNRGQFRAKSFRNGQLKIAARSSAEAYLCRQRVDNLIDELNAALGRPLVKTIKIIVELGN